MTGTILILTEPKDVHADLVEAKLRARGERVVRFDWADFPARASLSVAWSGRDRQVVLRLDGARIDLRGCKSGWLRRPGKPRVNGDIEARFLRDYVEEECLRVIQDTCNALDTRWLPGTFAALRRADNKQLQLGLAAELGFEIPPTLITSDPEEFLAFYRRHDGKLIDKLPSTVLPASQRTGRELMRYTQPVTTRDVGYARRLRHSPVLFQPNIAKKFELRITVVDDQVLAAEIHSQTTKRTQLDWRHYDWDHTPYRPHALPDDIRERCLRLTRSLGLRFGAIDMIVTPRGDYVFLEINPNGQWRWIEDQAGLPISDALCDALARPAPPRIRAAGIDQLRRAGGAVTAVVAEPAVADALELLVRLHAERLPPEAAWDEILRLRERHPGRFLELVWERESYLDRIHYDVLVGVAGATLSVGYCADDDVPWPVRGLQRVNESLVLRVDGDPVRIGQVITSLDYAWHKLHIGRHLIDMSLIDQEIRDRRIEVSDQQLDAALTAFRVRRRLFTAAAVERWMAEHGASPVELEHHLRLEVARDELRRQVTGGPDAHPAYFAAHRAGFDRVQLARIQLADRGAADALHRELRAAPQRFLAAAQHQFLQGAAHGEIFVTVRRDELEADQAAQLFDTEPGQIAPVQASGDGFEVVQVLGRVPAVLDDATRALIDERLFERWLDDRRSHARVEWFWGEAEAADVPAIAL